jgi:hypothetical protein
LAQADVIFSDTRSTAGTDSLDMVGGGLLDNLGNVWAPARIKGIIVFAAAANPGNVLLRRPAANGVPFMTAAGDEIPIHPGGVAVIWAPSAAGYVVTAATADLIDLAAERRHRHVRHLHHRGQRLVRRPGAIGDLRLSEWS